jgi:hypothetical protein
VDYFLDWEWAKAIARSSAASTMYALTEIPLADAAASTISISSGYRYTVLWNCVIPLLDGTTLLRRFLIWVAITLREINLTKL